MEASSSRSISSTWFKSEIMPWGSAKISVHLGIAFTKQILTILIFLDFPDLILKWRKLNFPHKTTKIQVINLAPTNLHSKCGSTVSTFPKHSEKSSWKTELYTAGLRTWTTPPAMTRSCFSMIRLWLWNFAKKAMIISQYTISTTQPKNWKLKFQEVNGCGSSPSIARTISAPTSKTWTEE